MLAAVWDVTPKLFHFVYILQVLPLSYVGTTLSSLRRCAARGSIGAPSANLSSSVVTPHLGTLFSLLICRKKLFRSFSIVQDSLRLLILYCLQEFLISNLEILVESQTSDGIRLRGGWKRTVMVLLTPTGKCHPSMQVSDVMEARREDPVYELQTDSNISQKGRWCQLDCSPDTNFFIFSLEVMLSSRLAQMS